MCQMCLLIYICAQLGCKDFVYGNTASSTARGHMVVRYVCIHVRAYDCVSSLRASMSTLSVHVEVGPYPDWLL